MKQIMNQLVFLIAIIYLAFASSAIAFDLGGLVDTLKKAVQPPSQPAAEPEKSSNPVITPSSLSEAPVNSSNPSENSPTAEKSNFVTPAEYCHALVSNPTLQHFSELVKSAESKDVYLDTDRELSNFDYGNKMIEEWTQGKTSELGKQGINKFFDSVLKTCGKELVDSDFTFVIIHDRVKMSNKGMGREKIEYCKSQKIKKIDDDGKISMVEPSCDSEIDDYYKFMEKHLFMPKILIVRNSEKVLQGASAEYMSQLESRINQEASEKKTSDAAHSAEVANEKANEKASLARIEQIKATGNYSIAQNCYEYAKASNAQKLIGLPNPLVSPDGKMYFMFAKLYKFSGGSGYLESSGAYAGISTTGKTHWESKEKTLINSMVAVVGKYVGNGDVTLVSGAEQSLRNYEVMCIEPISDVGVMMELFRN